MKTYLVALFLIGTSVSYSQDYQLIPDSCTYCVFLSSTGFNSWRTSHYKLDPSADTLYNGNIYTQIQWGSGGSGAPLFPIGVRQIGNKLYGAFQDSLSEFLIMDFDALVGDTIYDLYSEGFLYNAKVITKDSVLVNYGDYHNYLVLEGFDITHNGNPAVNAPNTWNFTWNERALCSAYFVQEPLGYEYGGVLYNIPGFYLISIPYAAPTFCTSDPIYTNPNSVLCDNCNLQTNSLEESSTGTFSISPNPVRDDLNIIFEVAGIKDVYIYNSVGSSVSHLRTKSSNAIISVEKLSRGLYTIEIRTNGLVSRKKFIVE
jgi:hypothetical protein